MKRAFFGAIWFFALAFLGVVGGGAVVGFMAGSKIQATNIADGYAKGREAGSIVGAEFGRNYTGVIVLGALVLSVAGTVLGVLPGTRRR
jgi:hypothetical protein